MTSKKYTTQPRKADFKDDPVPPIVPKGDFFDQPPKLKLVPRFLPPKPPVKPKLKEDKLPKGQSIA